MPASAQLRRALARRESTRVADHPAWPIDDQSGARTQFGQIDRGIESRSFAKYYITGPGIDTVGIGTIGTDNDIIKTIAIEIPCRTDKFTRVISVSSTSQAKAIGTIQARQIQCGTES